MREVVLAFDAVVFERRAQQRAHETLTSQCSEEWCAEAPSPSAVFLIEDQQTCR